MKFLKIIGIVIVVIVLGVVVMAAMSDDSIQIEESIVINKSPEVIYDQISDYKTWTAWSPWEDRDPNMKIEYSENTGLGSWNSWTSESEGDGRQEIVVAERPTTIRSKMTFADFEGDNFAEWTFEAVEGGTKVTWTMDGAQWPFIFRPMVGMMTEMVTKDYQNGLASLKTVMEAMPDPEPVIEVSEVVTDSMQVDSAAIVAE